MQQNGTVCPFLWVETKSIQVIEISGRLIDKLIANPNRNHMQKRNFQTNLYWRNKPHAKILRSLGKDLKKKPGKLSTFVSSTMQNH